jgi:hypothetical protein
MVNAGWLGTRYRHCPGRPTTRARSRLTDVGASLCQQIIDVHRLCDADPPLPPLGIVAVQQRARLARPKPTTTTHRKPLGMRDEGGVGEGSQGTPFFMRPSEFLDQTQRQPLRQNLGEAFDGVKTMIARVIARLHPLALRTYVR